MMISYINIPSEMYVSSENRPITDLWHGAVFTVNAPLTIENGSYKTDIRFLGLIPFKEVKVNVMPDIEVIPLGELVGIKLYTKGLLVVDCARFETQDNHAAQPAMDAGLRIGDIIVSINGQEIESIEHFSMLMNNIGGQKAEMVFFREDKQHKVSIRPKLAKGANQYRIGVWVRDSMAGVGTVTFCRVDNKKFAALGHGIVDADVGAVYRVNNGDISDATILNVQKGTKGEPGEIQGAFSENGHIFGSIEGNTPKGIYGTMYELPKAAAVKVAARGEIKEGPATIMCRIGSAVEEYNIEIQKLLPASSESAKSMLIKVTDEKLLSQTGGIVQGMSGSPILQNGKLIGAVTHVFINDPTRGYGIYADHMISMTGN